jgi:phosphate starvation-inducible PhoH-like protein
MEPWILPILDYFHEFYTKKQVEYFIESGIIDIVPLGFMRGRTFKNAYIIADEFQNSTPNQMKMLLTRIGEGSRIIVTGDTQQHDRGYEVNGLSDLLERLGNHKGMAVCKINHKVV